MRISLSVACLATHVGHMSAVLLSTAQETVANISIQYQLRMLFISTAVTAVAGTCMWQWLHVLLITEQDVVPVNFLGV